MAKHRAEVIEVYNNGGSAAVKFRYKGHDRIEYVLKAGMSPLFTVGMKGTIQYNLTPNGGLWSFTPKLTDTERANMRVQGAKDNDWAVEFAHLLRKEYFEKGGK